VCWYHERIDGRGGRPIAGTSARARIAPWSFFDATSRRPYRPGFWLPLETAVKELRTHRGTQWDGPVIDAFLAVIEREGVDWEKMNRTMDGDLGDGWPHARKTSP
jgi:response regulator RpfG family c-di-GMP phosphodiesterase